MSDYVCLFANVILSPGSDESTLSYLAILAAHYYSSIGTTVFYRLVAAATITSM